MTAFKRTFARLLADQGWFTAWTLVMTIALLGAWLCWAAWARVSLYEVSSKARVELDSATYPIESPVLGRVVRTELRIDRNVRRGEVLVELDAMAEQLQLRQEQVRADGLEPQVLRLRSQIASEEKARTEEQQSARLSTEEAADRLHEAEIAEQYAGAQRTRARELHGEQLIAEGDLEKAEAEWQMRRATVAAAQAASRRIAQEQATRDRERDVRLERLQGEISTLEAERATLKAESERLAYEIERRRIRSPEDGRVGEAETLRVGAVVHEGERLGSVLPSGHYRVVAQYPAEAVFGRIREGQTATMRLEGFPWAEFGTVSATVTHVAQEARDGKVRVELAIDAHSSFRGGLEHGMPGTIEVAVERVSPLSLVLRTAGQWLAMRP